MDEWARCSVPEIGGAEVDNLNSSESTSGAACSCRGARRLGEIGKRLGASQSKLSVVVTRVPDSLSVTVVRSVRRRGFARVRDPLGAWPGDDLRFGFSN